MCPRGTLHAPFSGFMWTSFCSGSQSPLKTTSLRMKSVCVESSAHLCSLHLIAVRHCVHELLLAEPKSPGVPLATTLHCGQCRHQGLDVGNMFEEFKWDKSSGLKAVWGGWRQVAVRHRRFVFNMTKCAIRALGIISTRIYTRTYKKQRNFIIYLDSQFPGAGVQGRWILQ